MIITFLPSSKSLMNEKGCQAWEEILSHWQSRQSRELKDLAAAAANFHSFFTHNFFSALSFCKSLKSRKAQPNEYSFNGNKTVLSGFFVFQRGWKNLERKTDLMIDFRIICCLQNTVQSAFLAFRARRRKIYILRWSTEQASLSLFEGTLKRKLSPLASLILSFFLPYYGSGSFIRFWALTAPKHEWVTSFRWKTGNAVAR